MAKSGKRKLKLPYQRCSNGHGKNPTKPNGERKRKPNRGCKKTKVP